MTGQQRVPGTFLRGFSGVQKDKLYFIPHTELMKYERLADKAELEDYLRAGFSSGTVTDLSESNLHATVNGLAIHACDGQESDSE
jgi:hypothetical protein